MSVYQEGSEVFLNTLMYFFFVLVDLDLYHCGLTLAQHNTLVSNYIVLQTSIVLQAVFRGDGLRY